LICLLDSLGLHLRLFVRYHAFAHASAPVLGTGLLDSWERKPANGADGVQSTRKEARRHDGGG